MFKPNDIVVKKTSGTEFVGRVVNIYDLPDNSMRMDVMNICPGARHLIHIYLPEQFRLATNKEIARVHRLLEIWDAE